MRKLLKLAAAVLAVGTVLWFLSSLNGGLQAGEGTIGNYVEARNAALQGN
jgi:hypothetical protein